MSHYIKTKEVTSLRYELLQWVAPLLTFHLIANNKAVHCCFVQQYFPFLLKI